MLGGADNSNGELQSYIIGANTFGHSIHLCPGNNLAQLETQILFEALLTKTNNISLLSTTPEWQKNLSVRSLVRLPVAFN